MAGKTYRVKQELDEWLMAHPGKKALILDPFSEHTETRYFVPNPQLPQQKEVSMAKKETRIILAEALEAAYAPQSMIKAARAGHYDDYKSDIATPIMALVQDATNAGLLDIARRAREGGFDAQTWEAEEWSKSREAQQIRKEFGL